MKRLALLVGEATKHQQRQLIKIARQYKLTFGTIGEENQLLSDFSIALEVNHKRYGEHAYQVTCRLQLEILRPDLIIILDDRIPDWCAYLSHKAVIMTR